MDRCHARSACDERRAEYTAAGLVLADAPKPRDREKLDGAVAKALSWGLPIVGLSPSAAGHMPPTLVAAARHRLVLPPVNASVMARTIELVTGRRCRAADLTQVASEIELLDLAVALRHDRTPAECIDELRRLQADRARKQGARELTLSQLHGLEPAVEWARGLMADLAAWRRGEISWAAVDHGAVLDGPPGTGKTLFAQVVAAETRLPFISASLSKWQSNGHLGDLLKAMRADFAMARARAPAIMFIDEVDAFADRSTITHDHKDYSVQVINGFIELLDGTDGREGLILIAASNDVRRCDPAIVRSGRLNRIIRINLPDVPTRARMLRVRLGADLSDMDLDRVARVTEGMTGADIEKVVKSARQTARRAGRELIEADLLGAVTAGERERPPELLRRFAVHEAGHALLYTLLVGHEGLVVSLQARDGAEAWVQRRRTGLAGTKGEIEAEIATLLGGRVAEELVLGEAGAGCGGSLGSDLHLATRLAAAMVGSLGHAGPHPLLFVSPLDRTDEILSCGPLRLAATEILDRAYERARSLIGRHRPALDRVVEALLATGYLDGDAVAALVAGPGRRRSLRSRDAGRAQATLGRDLPMITEPGGSRRGRCLPQKVASTVAPRAAGPISRTGPFC